MGKKLNHRVKQKPSQEETGSESDVGVGSGLSPGSASGQAHMEIPVASDGRVGSALRAAWCRGQAQHGVSGLGDREALPSMAGSPEGALHWSQSWQRGDVLVQTRLCGLEEL